MVAAEAVLSIRQANTIGGLIRCEGVSLLDWEHNTEGGILIFFSFQDCFVFLHFSLASCVS